MKNLLMLALMTLVWGCSDNPSGGDVGLQPDKNPLVDTGGPTPDKGPPSEQGPTTDKGPAGDKGNLTCDPSFGQAQACGGAVVGKWKYTAGCVADAAFDDLKTDCPGVQISGVAYNVGTNNTVTFVAGGSFTRVFTGSIVGKAAFGQACTKLGCTALQAAVKLAVAVKYPGSTIQCTANTASGCDCDVDLKVSTFAAGTYTTSSGVLTAKVVSVDHPYYYCIQGTRLVYHGTPQNTNDHNVTYVLELVP
jgi:hypothetical protein